MVVMTIKQAKYSVGDLVHHRLFDYRGVIYDADSEFSLTDEWYEQVALSRPPKDEPWYHVLVHGATQTTYVAEQNLESDISSAPINNPMVSEYFASFENGRYVMQTPTN
jgi:heat shock protein HspQ